MEYIVTKTIPIEDLKEYKDYVGFLFLNQDGVYNICRTEEDVMKSNQWFKNFPLNSIVVSDDKIEVGDKFLAKATNRELNGKTFKYLGLTEGGVGLIDIQDKDGKKHVSTLHLLYGAYKFVRLATMEDKERLVNGVIRPLSI